DPELDQVRRYRSLGLCEHPELYRSDRGTSCRYQDASGRRPGLTVKPAGSSSVDCSFFLSESLLLRRQPIATSEFNGSRVDWGHEVVTHVFGATVTDVTGTYKRKVVSAQGFEPWTY